MEIDKDTTKPWYLRFDTDDLIEAEALIDFVMFHKVQGSSDYSTYDKYVMLTAWEKIQSVLWEKDNAEA